MRLLYPLSISVYSLLIWLLKPFHEKAALLFAGRKNTFHLLQKFKKDQRKLAWFHCASLGEFEQARPVIEYFKQQKNYQIAVSFFSPSGYEVRKNYALADVIFYLPADTSQHAKLLLQLLQPDVVFIVKYEIWVNYINAISQQNIPLYLLSANFHSNHIYFKWYGKFLRDALRKFTHVFTQTIEAENLLRQFGFSNVVTTGDTRYDRVLDTISNPMYLPLVSTFKGANKLIVAGSSYPTEETILCEALKQFDSLKIVIAPHEIKLERLVEIENTFNGFSCIRYSHAKAYDVSDYRVLIIDNIGMLSSLYQYADAAFIGGGYGSKGIHNTLEAAAFGMPVFVGPNKHDRFPEVGDLLRNGSLFVVDQPEHFNQQFNQLWNNEKRWDEIKILSKNFVQQQAGATQKVLQYLTEQSTNSGQHAAH
jgi:3-deoxy-D-manno-octulosonic-acid transferase